MSAQVKTMSGGPATAPVSTERRTIAAIIADLSKPIPERHLCTKTLKGKSITYLSWHVAVKFLEHYAAGWSYEVRSVNQVGNLCIVCVRITIPASDGIVWREATGSESLDVNSYGDASSNAESMALRRAAAKFGLGLYLYTQPKNGAKH